MDRWIFWILKLLISQDWVDQLLIIVHLYHSYFHMAWSMFSIGRYLEVYTAKIRDSIITNPCLTFSQSLTMIKALIVCALIILPSGDTARLLGRNNSSENSLPGDPPGEASEDCPPGWIQTSQGCYLFIDIILVRNNSSNVNIKSRIRNGITLIFSQTQNFPHLS